MALTKTPIELSSTPSIVDNSDGAAITIDINENVTVSQNFTVDGDTFLNGNLTFGDAFTDTINFSSVIGSNLVPETTNTHDLGTTLLRWRDLFIDGTANINIVAADSGSTVNDFQVGGDFTVIGSPNLPYDNVISGLTANTVQSAITEIASLVGAGNVGSQASFDIFEFTATGGQTTFDLSGVHSQTYIVGYLQVFLNGLMLSETDYTANDGSNVVLSVAAELGDILTIVKVDSFDTAQILRTISIDASATTNAITLDQNDNVTLLGELRGPASFVIDPAAIGDNTGVVVIKGDLQVDGSQTTINSTTLDTEMVKVTGTFPSETSASTGYFDYASGTARITSKGIDDTTLGAFSVVQQASDASPENTPFHIDTTSNIGVGLTTQTEKFEVRDGNVFLSTNANTADTGSSIFWQSVDTGWDSANAHASIAGKRIDAANGYLNFSVRNAGTTSEVARFGSNGNFGINSSGNTTSTLDLTEPSDTAERAIRIENASTRLYVGVEGAAANRFIGSTVDNGFIGTTTAQGLEFGTNNNVRMVIDTSGNVGIGTTSTTNDAKLIIETADGKHPAIKINDGGATGFTLLADNYTATESILNLGLSFSNANVVLSRAVKVSDVAGNTYLSSQAQGSTKPNAFTINDDGSFRFLNTDTSATTAVDTAVTLSERMRIDSSGRLLINKILSTGSLSLESQAPSGFSVGSGFYSAVSQSTIEFQDTNTTANYKVRIGSETDDLLMFAGGTERMRIDASGNVGIGANSPVSFGANTAGLTINSSSGSHITWQNNGTNVAFAYNAGNNFLIGSEQASSNTIFVAAGTERMRINSFGNVGIGTNSPSDYYADKLVVSAGYADGITIAASATTDLNYLMFADTTTSIGQGWIGYYHNEDALTFASNSTERMRIDSSGRVGIGVTPSTLWSSSYDALQIGLGGSMYAHESAASNVGIAANSVYEGVAPNFYDKYLTSSTATKYVQDSGLHIWSTAASGTAGDAITWSEAMRIDASGNVGIGVVPTLGRLHVKAASGVVGWFETTGLSGALGISNSGTFGMQIDTASSSGFLTFTKGSGTTEFGRFDTDGNLLVGRTDAQTANNTAGIYLFPEGGLGAQRDSNPSLFINRFGTDGDMAVFRKDGAPVGSIGSTDGTYMYAGTGDTGILFNLDGDGIQPWNPSTNTNSNALLNLGFSGSRFKDLYLSGKVTTGPSTSSASEDIYNGGSGRTFQIPISINGAHTWVKISAMNHNGIIEQTIYFTNTGGQWGQLQATANTTGTPPTITVNLGTPSTTGSIVVLGQGSNPEFYSGGFIIYEMGPGLTFA